MLASGNAGGRASSMVEKAAKSATKKLTETDRPVAAAARYKDFSRDRRDHTRSCVAKFRKDRMIFSSPSLLRSKQPFLRSLAALSSDI